MICPQPGELCCSDAVYLTWDLSHTGAVLGGASGVGPGCKVQGGQRRGLPGMH